MRSLRWLIVLLVFASSCSGKSSSTGSQTVVQDFLDPAATATVLQDAVLPTVSLSAGLSHYEAFVDITVNSADLDAVGHYEIRVADGGDRWYLAMDEDGFGHEIISIGNDAWFNVLNSAGPWDAVDLDEMVRTDPGLVELYEPALFPAGSTVMGFDVTAEGDWLRYDLQPANSRRAG